MRSVKAMSSRLVVLGSCGGWPEPGRACSGFLLEDNGFRLVIDLGYGTLPRLLDLLGSVVGNGIDAVVITHRHPDHMIDLHGLFRARSYGHRGAPSIPLYAPPGVLERLAILEEGDADAVRQVFDWHETPSSRTELGPLHLDTWALPHFVPNVGVRLSGPDFSVAYTGDTGFDPALADLGRDADLYIVDATSRDQQPGSPPSPTATPLLLSAREAGRAATAAGAHRLMLTHFWPGNDREQSRAEAATEFGGEILLADEGLVVPLG
jgi:ribonuclease BN (tRNA processing enzyme)